MHAKLGVGEPGRDHEENIWRGHRLLSRAPELGTKGKNGARCNVGFRWHIPHGSSFWLLVLLSFVCIQGILDMLGMLPACAWVRDHGD